MATASQKSKAAVAANAAAVKAAAANPELVLLVAIEPIRYNNQDIEPDGEFACDAKSADQLLEINHARLAGEAAE